MKQYAKAVTAVVGAVLTAAGLYLGPDNEVARLVTALLPFLTALGVYNIPNRPSFQ